MGRVAARVEIDALDEARVDHRGARRRVEEIGHADPVEEIPDVARRGAAYVEERQPRDDRRDAGEDLDRAEGVAEGAG
jgi:hypothetical protein